MYSFGHGAPLSCLAALWVIEPKLLVNPLDKEWDLCAITLTPLLSGDRVALLHTGSPELSAVMGLRQTIN